MTTRSTRQKGTPSIVGPGHLAVTWLGHSTTLLELDGARVLTDPVLGERVAHLRRHHPRPEAPEAVDVVLVSHVHRDHLDLRSLRLLPRTATLVVPRGARRLVARLGFREVAELAEGDQVEVAGLRVTATHAKHARGRGILPYGPVPVGYLIEGSSTVYFAGDTDYFPGMASLAPDLDVALLPVSGWGPRVPTGHLDPLRAAQALQLLAPRICIPIHWDTLRPFYRRHPYELGSAAGERFAAMARVLAPAVDVRILRPGGRSDLSV